MKLVRLPRDVERIIRLQRDQHRAVAALVDEIEAVIEELAEQCEPGVERSRQTFVGRNVGEVDVVTIQLDAVGGQQRVKPAGDAGAASRAPCAAVRAAAASAAAVCSAALSGLAAAAAAAAASTRWASATASEFVLEAEHRQPRSEAVMSMPGSSTPARCNAVRIAAGLPSVWSTIRLEIVRTSGSMTSPGSANVPGPSTSLPGV